MSWLDLSISRLLIANPRMPAARGFSFNNQDRPSAANDKLSHSLYGRAAVQHFQNLADSLRQRPV
jgi:hypothetical protein